MFSRPLAVLALGAALLVPAANASASELSLSWDRCFSDGNVHNKTFACNTNEGVEHLVGSYRLDEALPQVVGAEFFLDIVAQGGVTLPNYWQHHNTGTCRMSSLLVRPEPSSALVHCLDLWNGRAAGGLAAYRTWTSINPPPSPDRARAFLVFGVPEADQYTAPAGEDVFLFDLQINHARTIGSPVCAGCDVPMCLTFTSLNLTRAAGMTNLRLPNGNTQGWKATVVWQGAQGAATTVTCNRFGICEFGSICAIPTPVQNRTWGTLKSLYR